MARSSTMLRTHMSRVDLTMTDACDRGSAADPTIQYDGDLGQFRNRVRVLAEVVNDADEISLISTLFRKCGWLVRAPRDGEVHSCPQQNRTWLIIEVRFPGSTRSAAKQAAKRIQLTAAEFRLGLWVRLVQVVDFPHEQDAPYYIDAAVPDWLARHSMLARVLRLFGVPRTTGLLTGTPWPPRICNSRATCGGRSWPAIRSRPPVDPARPQLVATGRPGDGGRHAATSCPPGGRGCRRGSRLRLGGRLEF